MKLDSRMSSISLEKTPKTKTLPLCKLKSSITLKRSLDNKAAIRGFLFALVTGEQRVCLHASVRQSSVLNPTQTNNPLYHL